MKNVLKFLLLSVVIVVLSACNSKSSDSKNKGTLKINGTPSTSINEDTSYLFIPTTIDVQSGKTLTFSIENKPSWATFSTSSGKLSGTPDNSDVGITNDINISVTDGSLGDSLDLFNLTVVNVNDAPSISGTANTSIAESTNYSFTPTASDIDIGTTLTFSIENKPSWATFSTSSGELSGTPQNSDVGVTNDINISVTDGSLSDSLPLFNLTVLNINDAPIATSTSFTTNEDTVLNDILLATDVDNSNLKFYKETNTTNGSINIDLNGSFTYTPNTNFSGNDSFTYKVNDTSLDSNIQTVTINVQIVNDAPVLTSSKIVTIDENQLGVTTLTASDEEGDNITFNIKNPNISIFKVNTTSGIVEFKDINDSDYEKTVSHSYNFIAIISDGVNNVEEEITVKLNNITGESTNNAPTGINLVDNNGTVNENNAINVQIDRFTTDDEDGNGTTFTYSLVNELGVSDNTYKDNDNFHISTNKLYIDIESNFEIKSKYYIRVQTKDDENATFDKEITITINNINDLATFDTTPILTIKQNDEYNYIAKVSDEDEGALLNAQGNTIGFGAVNTSGSGTSDVNISIFKTMLDEDVGVHSFVLNVLENDNNTTVSQSFDVNVTNINDKPESNVTSSDNYIAYATNGIDSNEIFNINDGDLNVADDVLVTALSSDISSITVNVTGGSFNNEKNVTVVLNGKKYPGESNITITMTDTGGNLDGGEHTNSFTFLAKVRAHGLGLYEEQKNSNYSISSVVFDDINYTWDNEHMWYETSTTVLMPIKILENDFDKGITLQSINNGGHYYMNKNQYINEIQHTDTYSNTTLYKTVAVDTNKTIDENDFSHDALHHLFVSRVIKENIGAVQTEHYKIFTGNDFNKTSQPDINTTYAIAPGFIGSTVDFKNDGNATSNICAIRYGKGWRIPTSYELGKEDDTNDEGINQYYIPSYLGDLNKFIWSSTSNNADPSNTNPRIWAQRISTGEWRHLNVASANSSGFLPSARCVYSPY